MINAEDIKRITDLCNEKGWVPPELAIRVAGEVGAKKVIGILEKQPGEKYPLDIC